MTTVQDPQAAGTSAAGTSPLPQLDVRGVTLQYKTKEHLVTATYRVDFQVFKSDRYVVLGPSGCGKSTLLKAVGGYMAPVRRRNPPEGQAGHAARPGPDDGVPGIRPVAALEDGQGKRDVPAAGVTTSTGARRRRTRPCSTSRRSTSRQFANTIRTCLSGGMKQRVAIARGMAMEPEVLLMDEPFAALDALTRRKMQDELLQLWDDTHFTVLFVTHSIAEAIKIGSRILLLSPHPGQVKAELESVPRDSQDSAAAKELEMRIHSMLFS